MRNILMHELNPKEKEYSKRHVNGPEITRNFLSFFIILITCCLS